MQGILKWLAARLIEPSSWMGIAAAAGAIGIAWTPEMWIQIGALAAAVIGFIQFVKKEKEPPPE